MERAGRAEEAERRGEDQLGNEEVRMMRGACNRYYGQCKNANEWRFKGGKERNMGGRKITVKEKLTSKFKESKAGREGNK